MEKHSGNNDQATWDRLCRKRVTRQMCSTLGQSFSMPAAVAGSTSIERRSIRPCVFSQSLSNETRGKNRLVESRLDILPQVLLIVLDRQDVAAPLSGDLRHD
jgi:hypothetical protein